MEDVYCKGRWNGNREEWDGVTRVRALPTVVAPTKVNQQPYDDSDESTHLAAPQEDRPSPHCLSDHERPERFFSRSRNA